mmetsp:Transcript_45887/g.121701  ORF Transcript_45887/g.121701 Transcript_45887/m.121701 type:complete len:200 (-) Transcript_45887:364-963(-)
MGCPSGKAREKDLHTTRLILVKGDSQRGQVTAPLPLRGAWRRVLRLRVCPLPGREPNATLPLLLALSEKVLMLDGRLDTTIPTRLRSTFRGNCVQGHTREREDKVSFWPALDASMPRPRSPTALLVEHLKGSHSKPFARLVAVKVAHHSPWWLADESSRDLTTRILTAYVNENTHPRGTTRKNLSTTMVESDVVQRGTH